MEALKTINIWAKTLGYLGLVMQFIGVAYYIINFQFNFLGIISIVIGTLSIFLFFFISRQQIKQLIKQRSIRLGFGTGISVFFCLTLIFFLGALFLRHHVRWDLSLGKKHTLAPQTISILKKLNTPINAYAFMREDQQGYIEILDLLELYTSTNSLFSYQIINPDREPIIAKRYDIRTYGTLILTKEKSEERIKLIEEQGLTNAIVKLGRTNKKKIYFVTGHGEHSLNDINQEGYSDLNKAIEQQNYDIKPLILATTETIPPDIQLIVLAGPKKNISEPEQKYLGDYLAKGKSLIIMLDPQFNAGLTKWLIERGIELGDNFIIDPQSRFFGTSAAWPLTTDFADHEITRSLKGMLCYFPLVRTVEIIPKNLEGITTFSLIRSSPSSWADNAESYLFDDQIDYNKKHEHQGPLSLAVLASITSPGDTNKEQKIEQSKKKDNVGQLLVIGNSTFITNNHLNQAGNRDFILNAISFLAEEQDLIAIRPKEIANQPILINPTQAQVIFWISIVFIPLIFFVTGIIVVASRRKKLT